MILKEAMGRLEGVLLTPPCDLDVELSEVFASNRMSDVLARVKPSALLLTDLVNLHVVRTASVADIAAVVFVQGKRPEAELVSQAQADHLPLISAPLPMAEACRRVGLPWTESEPAAEDRALHQEFEVKGGDFAHAGAVSCRIKNLLKELGLQASVVRRVAIATYEAEMNVIMYAGQGRVDLAVTPEEVRIVVADQGPGIPDIDLAMREGYSTATPEMRALGFGAGMGLPNIKKNSDLLNVSSDVGRGTRLEIVIRANGRKP
jgi:anti-sigma regulatory factor (Ser/Thr protein kinase)